MEISAVFYLKSHNLPCLPGINIYMLCFPVRDIAWQILERQKCHLIFQFWHSFLCGKPWYISKHWQFLYLFIFKITLCCGQHLCYCVYFTVEEVDSEISKTFPKLLETRPGLLGTNLVLLKYAAQLLLSSFKFAENKN